MGRVVATDPDNDTLRYTVTAGPNAEYYTVDADGWISLKKDMPLTAAAVHNISIVASDGRLSQTVAATITLRQLVYVSGDIHGVEAPVGTGRDTIRLDFRRVSRDVSAALMTDYTVTWGTATAADLDNPTALVAAGQTTGHVTFAADQTLVTITLTPKQDKDLPGGGREELETFNVALVARSPDYTLLHPESYPRFKKDRLGLLGRREVDVSVLDAVTLFASNNTEATLADPAGTGGAHINDTIQGNIGDCFFIAAIGAMAQRRPVGLADTMRANADGTVTVYYYDRPGGPRRETTVTLSLEAGLEQAKLSMDYLDLDKEKAYEIWPSIMEKAYQRVKGHAALAGGGQSADVWKFFIGGDPGAQGRRETNDWTAAQIATEITAAFNAGRMVTVCTWLEGDNKTVIGPHRVVTGHAYVLTQILPANATLPARAVFYNPWGRDPITVALTDLKRCFYYYSIM